MSRILLILTGAEASPHATARALDLAAAAKSELVAAHVHDPETAERYERRAMEQGFLGERVGEMVHQALFDDEQVRVREVLDAVSAQAQARSVACQTVSAQGRFAPTVMRLAAEHDAGHVVLARPRHSRLRRLLHGSPVEELRRATLVKVEVVDEGS